MKPAPPVTTMLTAAKATDRSRASRAPSTPPLRSFHSGHSAPASRSPSTPPLRSFHSVTRSASRSDRLPRLHRSLRRPLSEHASATFLTVPRLFLSPPDVGARERARLLEAFDSNWIAPLGPARRRVRAGVRGLRRCAGTPPRSSSGTAALHLALVLLGVGPGDDVLVPSLTFVASANAVAYVGARPVFLDSDRATWNVDPGLVEEELAARAAPDASSRPRSSASTSTGSAPTGTRSSRSCARIRRAGDRGRGRGARGDVPRPPRRLVRRARTCSRSTATRSSPRAAAGCCRPTTRRDRTGASPEHAGARTGAALRAHRDRVQLPDEQPAGRGRSGAARGPRRPRSRAGARSSARYREAFADVAGHRVHARRRRRANPPTGSPSSPSTDPHAPSAVRTSSRSTSRPGRRGSPCTCNRCSPTASVRGGAVAEEIFRTGLCLPSGSVMTDADVDRVVAGVLQVVDAA